MLNTLILGAIQGLTEFFPVSSSGHLVIAQHFLGVTQDVLFLDTFLHIGTLLALLLFFAKDIFSVLKSPRTLGYIAIATLITGAIGIVFKKNLESLFVSPNATLLQMLANGLILLAVPFFKERGRAVRAKESAIMGVAQGIAIIPAISRSGLTIASLMACGVKREEAFRFSFVASIPAVLGAFLLEAKDIHFNPSYSFPDLATGLASSFVFGLLALSSLYKIIQKKKLHFFGYYCILLSLALLFFFKI